MMTCTDSQKRLCKDSKCVKCFNNSFASHEKSKHWSPENELDPREVFLSSNKRYKFDCSLCKHQFEKSPNSISFNNGWCPFCSHKALCDNKKCLFCFEGSFASDPRSKHWSTKNNLSSRDVFKNSHKRYLFDCSKCHHTFDKRLSEARKNWCPYCSHKALCSEDCSFCFENSFASDPKSKHWSDKNDVSPRDVFKNSHERYLFDCSKCNHTFEKSLSGLRKGWCSYCSHRALCGGDCSFCFENSFASEPKSKYWSVKNDLSPRDVSRLSDDKFWFSCKKCDHDFESPLYEIVCKGRWCPFCVGKKMCFDENCDFCNKRSFKSVDKSKYWSKKNLKSPREVARCSNVKYLFDCPCGHEFSISPSSVVAGSWCPYESNQKLCTDITCASCFKRSFANHKFSKYMIEENIKPREISMFSKRRCSFTCENDHTFKTTICSITNMGSWCPFCKNKTEEKLFKWLKNTYKDVRYQPRYDWCKKKISLPFDFSIQEIVIIELDGPQHFKQVSNWKSPEEVQIIDRYKEQKALENGYMVIRLLQEDVWKDRIDWKKRLEDLLEKVVLEVVCIY